jgi:hypothetical protein
LADSKLVGFAGPPPPPPPPKKEATDLCFAGGGPMAVLLLFFRVIVWREFLKSWFARVYEKKGRGGRSVALPSRPLRRFFTS